MSNTIENPPTRAAIDGVSTKHPVFLYRLESGSAIANSVAFARGGLKNDASGVERDSNGVPTGVVRGDAVQRISRVVPPDHTRNWPEIAETATNYAASLGVTSVQDMHSDDSRAGLSRTAAKGKLKTRVYDCVPMRDWKSSSIHA
jgi:predicted amidohydrolase YtcJ